MLSLSIGEELETQTSRVVTIIARIRMELEKYVYGFHCGLLRTRKGHIVI